MYANIQLSPDFTPKMLEQAHEMDRFKTFSLLETRIPRVNDMTILTLAIYGNLRSVIASKFKTFVDTKKNQDFFNSFKLKTLSAKVTYKLIGNEAFPSCP